MSERDDGAAVAVFADLGGAHVRGHPGEDDPEVAASDVTRATDTTRKHLEGAAHALADTIRA